MTTPPKHMRICVDLTKLNENVDTEDTTDTEDTPDTEDTTDTTDTCPLVSLQADYASILTAMVVSKTVVSAHAENITLGTIVALLTQSLSISGAAVLITLRLTEDSTLWSIVI